MRKRWELAKRHEVQHVMNNIRKEDFQEGMALRGIDIRPWVVEHYNPGTTYVLKDKQDVPGGIAGVDPVGNDQGLVWMLGTDLIVKNQIEFLRYSRAWIDEACRPYEAVGNLVHAKNEVHLKWLQWCGFTFLRKLKAGPFDEEFIEFIRIM